MAEIIKLYLLYAKNAENGTNSFHFLHKITSKVPLQALIYSKYRILNLNTQIIQARGSTSRKKGQKREKWIPLYEEKAKRAQSEQEAAYDKTFR